MFGAKRKIPNFAPVSKRHQRYSIIPAKLVGLGNTGKYQSGQMGQTVNLLAYAFGGSNPSLPTLFKVAEVAQLIEH